VTTADVARLLTKFNARGPAREELIREFEDKAGFELPGDYKQFLRRADGGEGFVGHAYLILWPVEQLQELNDAYQVEEYASGLLLFGSDGGGEAYAFDTRAAGKPIVSVPFVGMERQLARAMGADFREFLERLSRS